MIDKNKRPKIHMKISKAEVVFEIIAIVSIIISWWYLITMWDKMPNVVPTHFNFKGEVNGYGSKNSLFILPIMSVIMFIAFNILSMFPHIFNYPIKITMENAKRQYANARLLLIVIMAEINVIFLYLQWGSIYSAITPSAGTQVQFMPIGIFIIIATVIVFISKMKKSQ